MKQNKKELIRAYQIVIKDLKKHDSKCAKYCFGCYGCAVKRLTEDLEDYKDLIFYS